MVSCGSRPHCGRRLAFTLLELLVVISIIALMLAMLMPALGKARESARNALCLGSLQQIQQLTEIYAQENRGRLPEFFYQQPTGNSGNFVIHLKDKSGAATGWSNYLDDMLICPSDPEPAVLWFKNKGGAPIERSLSYGFNLDLVLRAEQTGLRYDTIRKPTLQTVFYDGFGAGKFQGAFHSTTDYVKRTAEFRHNNWANAGFADGHAESLQVITDEMVTGGQPVIDVKPGNPNPGNGNPGGGNPGGGNPGGGNPGGGNPGGGNPGGGNPGGGNPNKPK